MLCEENIQFVLISTSPHLNSKCNSASYLQPLFKFRSLKGILKSIWNGAQPFKVAVGFLNNLPDLKNHSCLEHKHSSVRGLFASQTSAWQTVTEIISEHHSYLITVPLHIVIVVWVFILGSLQSKQLRLQDDTKQTHKRPLQVCWWHQGPVLKHYEKTSIYDLWFLHATKQRVTLIMPSSTEREWYLRFSKELLFSGQRLQLQSTWNHDWPYFLF